MESPDTPGWFSCHGPAGDDGDGPRGHRATASISEPAQARVRRLVVNCRHVPILRAVASTFSDIMGLQANEHGPDARVVLTARHCAPAVLAHLDIPEHHNLLTGERYGCPLPWPPGVHQLTGTLMLPPTTTPRGPITWRQPPRQDSLCCPGKSTCSGSCAPH